MKEEKMKIKAITNEEYDFLVKVQEQHPILTYQSKGYDTFDETLLSYEDEEAIGEVEKILKESVTRFSSFTNFTNVEVDGEEGLYVRLQYDYGAEDDKVTFTGVGYVKIEELLNGFE